MPAYLSPVGNEQQSDANGSPVSGALIYTYLAGTTTPVTTYSDSGGTTPQANPIVCNTAGYPANPIYLPAGQAVKMVFTTSLASGGSAYRPAVDNIQGVNDPSFSTTVSEWQPLNLTATYISGTSFSVTGDQTLTLQVNRRLRSANTGGTAYSTITNSVYSAGVTTVTVSNDAVPLDSGLNSIYYALLAANNPSLPAIYAKSGLATASGLTMNTARMLGRTTAGVGAVQELDAAAVAAFTAAATTGAQGAVRLATTAEAAAGTAADRALTPAALRGGPIQSMVRLQNHAGYGSTNTVIRRFTNVITNVGSDITYADSATLGGSFTIVNAGVYAITTTYSHSADTNQGISVNSAQLTTDVSTITAANRLVSARDGAASGVVLCSWTGYLSAGDVIRAHGDAAAVGNAALATFTITRIA